MTKFRPGTTKDFEAYARPHGTMFLAETDEVRELNRIIERARPFSLGYSSALGTGGHQSGEANEQGCLTATFRTAAGAGLLELECANHGACDCRDEKYRNLQQENARLREALIRAGRAAGCWLADNVSAELLMQVPAEIEARIGRQTERADPLCAIGEMA